MAPYLFKHSPRLVPVGLEPECFKMHVLLTSEQIRKTQNTVGEGNGSSGPEFDDDTDDFIGKSLFYL
jgi:hypothetical protein